MIGEEDEPTEDAALADTRDAESGAPTTPEAADPAATETATTSEPAGGGEDALLTTGELRALTEQLGDPQAAPSLDGFVPASPVVTGLRPRLADGRGGTPITLLGAGFGPGCRVYVGPEELVAEVLDTFTMRFTAPAGEGTAKVFVESVSGKRSTSDVELAFATGPEIVRATPDEAPIEGGVHVVVDGARFQDGCTVSLFGVHAPEAVFGGADRVSFLVPPAGDGPLEGTLVITNPDGLSGRSETAFRYRPLEPRLTSVEPAHGWISGGKIVTVRGADIHERTVATVGGREATVRFRDRGAIDVEVPPADAPGVVDVEIKNPDGRTALLPGAFTYEPVPAPPKIIDVIPRTGSTVGGATVRITGDNFTDDVRVRIGEVTTMRKVVSAKLIDAELPPRALPGSVAIEISLEGVVVRAEEIFTYASPNAPKLLHLEPRKGPTSGGTRVTIEGEGFPSDATVRFGGEAAKTVVVKSPTKIEVVTPPGRAAVVDVEISSPTTGPGISKGGFQYEITPPPTITSVAPSKGTIDGGTELSVEGKNFAEGAQVLVGGLPAKTRRISGSLLEAKTPGGDDGKLVDVAVKNPDGQQGVQKRAFQYDARYRS